MSTDTVQLPIRKDFIDMTGMRFGMITVLSFAGKTVGGFKWNCRCDCGCLAIMFGGNLRRGQAQSCGCATKKKPSFHGMTKTREYDVWKQMIQRCVNPKAHAYSYYGGRGIKVCDRWRYSFEAFYADMGPRPTGLTIERLDNDGNYEPTNCVWATRKQQMQNTRPRRACRLTKEL